MVSTGEELVIDDEDILKRAITRTRKMKNMKDKIEVGSEEGDGRKKSFQFETFLITFFFIYFIC